MKNKFLLIVLFLATASLSEAQTVMENFAYGTTTGTSADSLCNPAFGGNPTLSSQRWRRHSGTGNPVKYLGTSLSYAGYNSSGLGGSAGFTFLSSSAEDAHRNVQTINSGNVYVSFLLKMTASGGTVGDYFFHIMDTSFITAFRTRIFIRDGSATGTYKIGINKGSNAAPAYSALDYKLDSTILVVVKYSFNSAFSDTASAYIFTSGIPSLEPTTATIIAPDHGTADLAVFNAIALRQGTVGTMNGVIDGIRVSNSWANGPLPVNLVNFSGVINPGVGTQLIWRTAQERNNKGFEVERSLDGENFETLDFVKGFGNSDKIQSYTYLVSGEESAFYRLKQIDFDGKYEYSPIVSVTSEIGAVELSPNPFVNAIKLNSVNTIEKVEIVDLTGKVLITETLSNQMAEIKTDHLTNGVYFINITQGGSVQTKRIVKFN
jgi:hypothetical protein